MGKDVGHYLLLSTSGTCGGAASRLRAPHRGVDVSHTHANSHLVLSVGSLLPPADKKETFPSSATTTEQVFQPQLTLMDLLVVKNGPNGSIFEV